MRWTLAVLLCLAIGGGTGYGITTLQRGRLPGLHTASDGRWAFPRTAPPALQPGEPLPGDRRANPAGRHFAALGGLLVPLPRGAVREATARGGAVPTLLALYQPGGRTKMSAAISEERLRSSAAEAWSMPDGTHTVVVLLQAKTGAEAESLLTEHLDVRSMDTPTLAKAAEVRSDDDEQTIAPHSAKAIAYAEAEPYGDEQVRIAYSVMGDTVAVVAQWHRAYTPPLPFHQTAVLQNRLLA
ncbi:hypothetical protein BIV57_04775 [Mangrovactinospora gilvigrisea]|uniref:Uncharacterized protein n=1 Tax=Mangrovactinospora gilvigrisea TaxID=1428644 RepID=A0A1J7BYS4_9ACTN|nr:hypothetical protein BIV57_04775 [Mangrovactinospora gilvigrisea]